MSIREGIQVPGKLNTLVFEAISDFDGQSETLEDDEFAREAAIGILCDLLEPHVDPEVIAETVKQRLDEILKENAED